MVRIQIINTTSSLLTPEGTEIATNGSHEARVWAALPSKGAGEPLTVPALQVSLPASLTCLG
jgi:phenylalanyl-tRNA synthetase alpha chain